MATWPHLIEDPRRPKRDPAAGRARRLGHVEIDVGRVAPIEEPPAIGLARALDDVDRLGQAFVQDAGVAEVVERAQDVVVVVGREREPREVGVDHLAGREPAEQPALEGIFVRSASGGGGFGGPPVARSCASSPSRTLKSSC